MSQPNVALALQGIKRSILGDESCDFGPGQLLVVGVDLPLTSHIVAASESVHWRLLTGPYGHVVHDMGRADSALTLVNRAI